MTTEGDFRRIVPQLTVERLTYIRTTRPEVKDSIDWETSVLDEQDRNIAVLGHGFKICIRQPKETQYDMENSFTTIKRIYNREDKWTRILIENKKGPVASIQLNADKSFNEMESYDTNIQQPKRRRTRQPLPPSPTQPQVHVIRALGEIVNDTSTVPNQIKSLHSFFRALFPLYDPTHLELRGILRLRQEIEDITTSLDQFKTTFLKASIENLRQNSKTWRPVTAAEDIWISYARYVNYCKTRLRGNDHWSQGWSLETTLTPPLRRKQLSSRGYNYS